MQKYLVFFISFFVIITFSLESYGDSNSDSLRALIKQTHNIDEKIDVYYAISLSYRNIDIDSSNYFAIKALTLSSQTDSDYLLEKIYSNLGDIAIARDSMNVAKKYYELALINFENKNNTEGIITILTVLGNIAFAQDNLSEALQFYQQGIDLAGDDYKERVNRLYFNIGSILYKSKQYAESQEYFSQALDAFIELKDTSEVARAYINLGSIYLILNDYDTAEEYFQQALEVYQSLDAQISIARTLFSLSLIKRANGDFYSAIRLLKESEKLTNENTVEHYEGPKNLLLTDIYSELGRNYLRIDKIDSSFYFVSKAYKFGLKNRQLEEVSRAAELLTEIWIRKGNSDSALFYNMQFKSYADTLYEEVNNRKLANQQAQFKYEQEAAKQFLIQEREDAIQKRNTFILFAAIVVLVLILALLILLLRLNRIRIKDIELEKQALNSELELKNKELTTYLMFQVKSNEFILNISEKLKNLLRTIPSENKAIVNQIIREIETDSSSDNWDEFIVRFHQVHTGFYKNLGKDYPDLTSNELRLCAFLKLNMNTKDIAAITYQSTKSITVARWRLRQKLGLKKEEKLSVFLSQF